MKEFEKLINTIFDLTHEYAIKNLSLDFNVNPSTWKEDEKRQFQVFVHRGFRQAQDLILNEILNIQESVKLLKDDLKSSRRERKAEKTESISKEIKKFEYQETILRSFVDFIAWQLLGQQYYRVRRFYDSRDKNNSRPTLSTSNIESVKNTVRYYHEQDELNFALISDLSSFIDIGDILLLKDNHMFTVEVKEGKINEEVFSFINELSKKEIETCPYSLISNPNEKFFKQVNRVMNQTKRAYKLTEFLNHEKGIDPFRECEVKVNKEPYIIDSYIDTVNNLFKELEKENWAYTIYEDVLTIGLYQKELLQMGDILLPHLNQELFGKPFPIVNYMQKLKIPINEPIFYQGLSREHIFDLFFGRIRMLISINIDNFIDLCKKNGLAARWLSKKETIKNKTNNKAILFEWKGQGIIINEEIILGDGIIARMIFDFTTPSSIIKNIKLQIAEKDV